FDRHLEDDYVDFYYERNLPVLLSREGPRVAKGDVNGDGLEDLYIGGAREQAGQLYLQKGDGSFQKSAQPLFEQFRAFEDVAVLFFDTDRDGDLDLFLGAGGNNVRPGEREIQHRLYKNDGRGGFSLEPRAFPPNSMNISVAAAYDYDGDGDEDLFVGGRSVPYVYGQLPRSYLYQNNGQGVFSEVDSPVLYALGMVTGAVWTDVTGDNKKELVVAGEWMAPRVFSVANGGLKELHGTGLSEFYGWWQSLAVADLNGDGKEDLVLGNIGENFYLRPTTENPVRLWVRDFDGNGTADGFLTRTVGGRDLPVFLKREVTDQFPWLKKDNLRHSDYAKKSIQELFGPEALKGAASLPFTFPSSIIALNIGKGKFSAQPLPVRGQLSSINAICTVDVNGDGSLDLITGGNLFTFPPQFGRLDASYGDLFVNNGKGAFTWMPNASSGIHVRGEVKDIVEIKAGVGVRLLIAQNNEAPVLYHMK
ncbi:MAG: VCBS repeat-containing protein, partial [Sphingobacteriales bacterium]